MTVSAIQRKRQEGSGRTHRYQIIWHVYCDSKADGPQSIDQWFQAQTTVPNWGDVYRDQYPTGAFDRQSYLTDSRSRFLEKVTTDVPDQINLNPNPVTQTYYLWETVQEFNPVGEYRLDYHYQQTTATTNSPMEAYPYYWQPRYRFSFARRQVDRLAALYQGTFQYPTNGTLDRATITDSFDPGGQSFLDTYRPVQNSARVQYDPPTRGTEADMVMRIRNYTPGWANPLDGSTEPGLPVDPGLPLTGANVAQPNFSYSPEILFQDYIGRVNCIPILHYDPEVGLGYGTGAGRTHHRWPKYTLKLESLQSNSVRINGYYLYENDWEFHYREGIPTTTAQEPMGWADIVPDISRYERETEDGKPCLKPIFLGGRQAVDGARLDGAGVPIVVGGSACDQSYWLAWLSEYTANFENFAPLGEIHFLRWDDFISDNTTVFTPRPPLDGCP